MVMVDGKLYLDTGKESSVEARCDMMDGEITSSVEGTQKPTQDGTIEIYRNEKWWVFATEEVRQEIQFPENSMD